MSVPSNEFLYALGAERSVQAYGAAQWFIPSNELDEYGDPVSGIFLVVGIDRVITTRDWNAADAALEAMVRAMPERAPCPDAASLRSLFIE